MQEALQVSTIIVLKVGYDEHAKFKNIYVYAKAWSNEDES